MRKSFIFLKVIFFCLVLSVFFHTTGFSISNYTTTELEEEFKTLAYDLQKIRDEKTQVPRFFLSSFPKDFMNIQDPDKQKNLFIKIILPLVLKKNEEIFWNRSKLLSLAEKKESGEILSVLEQQWLEEFFQKYEVEDENIALLISRLDIIPVSQVIAQAAEETGWGKSRFVHLGNALFGERTWSGDGIIPKKRENGKTFKVKSFLTLADSLESYMKKLNTNQLITLFDGNGSIYEKKKKIYLVLIWLRQ